MEDLFTWAKRIMKETKDSLLVTAAKDAGIDIYKVLTKDELKKIAGGGSCDSRLDKSGKDREPQ